MGVRKKVTDEYGDKIKCVNCTREIKNSDANYYQATEKSLYKGIGAIPICKKCLYRLYNEYYEECGDKRLAVYLMCRKVDVSFHIDSFNMAITQQKSRPKSNLFGMYMQKLNSWGIPRGAGLCFDDSDTFNGVKDEATQGEKESSNNEEGEDVLSLKGISKQDMIVKWGKGWDEYDYIKLEKFYYSMKDANKIETPQEIDYLKKLAKLSVKIDNAIDQDETSKVKSLGDLYSKYMTDSKFRAQDMSSADRQGGIRTFSQIYAEVEKDDFIPPWEKYAKIKKVKQDIVDKTIMHIENFTLKLNKVEKMTEPPSDTPKMTKSEKGD